MNDAVGIAYGDDLASLGLCIAAIQLKVDVIANLMLPFNLRINRDKPMVLTFVSAQHRSEFSVAPVNPNLFFSMKPGFSK